MKIVKDAFGKWSDFSKNLKKEVESQININLKELDISSYNHMILNVVKEKLDDVVHLNGVQKIKEDMDKMLSETQSEYKLSDLINKMKEDTIEDDDDYYGKEIAFYDDGDTRTLRFLSFDPDEDNSKYGCKYRISVDTEGKLSSVKIDGKEFNNKVIMGGLYGIEETLFKIYTNGSKLIVDSDEIDVEYGYEHDDY